MNDKFELIKSNKKTPDGKPLFRVKAKKAFGVIAKGELGGFVEKEANLSVYDNARVYGDAWVYGDARVYGDTWVSGKVKIDFRLCSRFAFSKKEQLDAWLALEKEFEKQVKE